MAKVKRTGNPQATAFEALPNVVTPEALNNAVTPEISSGFGSSYSSIDLGEYKNVKNKFLTGDDSQDITRLGETRASNQSTLGLIGKGLGNVTSTFISEIAKIPGYLGGILTDTISGNVFSGDFSNTVDNFWINGINWVKENTTDEAFKVYTPPSLENKSLVEQITNPYFWAKEGADGVGFLLSFLVPGQALKLLGLGGKAAKYIGKTGRVLDYEKIASTIDSGLAIGVNTLLESAAEGSNAYDNLIQQGYTPEEAGKLASNVVKWNIPTLLVSNLILEKYIMSGFGRIKGKSGFNRLTSDVIEGSKTLKKQYNPFKPNIATGLIQEGLFEEGLQTSIEQTHGKSLYDITRKYWDNITSMFDDDANKDAIDFGKSVILGGVLGGGMSTLGNVQENKASNRALFGQAAYNPKNTFERFVRGKAREAKEGLISVFKANYAASKEDAKELFEYNDAGQIVKFKPEALEKLKDGVGTNLLVNFYHDLIRKYDGNADKARQALIVQMGKQGADIHDLFQVHQDLSNEEVLEQIKNREDLNYFLNFLTHTEGANLLRQHIPAIAKQIAERYKNNTGEELKSIADVENELKEKAERYIKIYEKVDKAHSPYRLQVDPYKSGNEADRGDKFKTFFGKAKANKLALLSDIDLATERLEDINTKLEAVSEKPSRLELVEKRKLEKDKATYEKIKAESEEEYLKLDDTKSLQELWEEAYSKQAELETKKEAEEEIEIEEVKDYDDIIKKLGYSEFDNVHFISNGTRFTITKQADGKFYIRNEKDPSKVKIVDKPTFGKNYAIMSKEEVRQEREKRRIRENAIREKTKQQAIVLAMQEKLADLRKRQISTQTALDQINSDISETEKLIEEYNANIASKKDVRINKKLLKTANELLSSLKRSKETLDNENTLYKEQLELLELMVENKDYTKQAQEMFGEVTETIEDLRNIISTINTTLDELTSQEETLIETIAALKAMFNTHDVIEEMGLRLFTEEFTEKYSYINEAGDKVSLPNEYEKLRKSLAANRISKRVEAFIAQLASDKNIPVEQLKEELLRDLKRLTRDSKKLLYTSETVAELNASKQQLEVVENSIKELKAKLLEAKTKQNILTYKQLKSELNNRFKSIKDVGESQQRLKETGVSKSDKPESVYDGKQVWWDKVGNFLFATTGLSIEYGDNHKDLYTTTNNISHPVVSSSLYQRNWFEYLDSDPDFSDKRLLLTVANYDNSSDLERAFAGNNPNNQEPGKDIFAVIVDENNVPITYNGTPVFSSIKKVDTMFPSSGIPGVNMRTLYDLFARANGISSFKNPNKSDSEKLIDIFGTDKVSKEALDEAAIGWGRAEYIEFIETIRKNKQMYGIIGEVTSGHPIRLYDATTKELLTANPIKALELEFNSDGTPKNFEILQASKDGTLLVGDKVVGGFSPGIVYIKKNNDFTPLISDHLNDLEINLIYDMIKMFASRSSLKGFISPTDIPAKGWPEDKWMYAGGNQIKYSNDLSSKRLQVFPTKDSRFSLMTMLMNWGEFGNSEYDIYVYQKHLVLGTTKIPMDKLDEYEDEIKAFLSNKRFHINFSLLNSANKKYTPYFHPVRLDNGTLIFEERRFLPYILSRMSTEILPKAMYSKLGLPQKAQKNIEIKGLLLPNAPVPIISNEENSVPETVVPNKFTEALKEMGLDLTEDANPLLDIAGVSQEDVNKAEEINNPPQTTERLTLADVTFDTGGFFEQPSDEDTYKKTTTFDRLTNLINNGTINKKC